MDCAHANVKCVNPYEIIRKYLRHDCGGIFLCPNSVTVQHAAENSNGALSFRGLLG
jgi:hypothetical protein